jgi:hypothetical protein
MRLPLGGAVVTLFFGVALVLLLVQTSNPPAGQVRMRPAAGAPGSSAILAASGFPRSKRVVISVGGVRSRSVVSSPSGTFKTRITVPRRTGWFTVVSRGGRSRVINRFLVTPRKGAGQVTEVASARGQRLRLSPAELFPGSRLQLRGAGFGRSRVLRLSSQGAAHTVRTRRDGTFTTAIVLPPSARPGLSTLVVSGGGPRFSLTQEVSAPSGRPRVLTKPAVPTNITLGQRATAGAGTYSGTPPIATKIRWRRCGNTCVNAGSGKTYVPTAADVGFMLRVVVTATNRLSSIRTTSYRSSPVKPRIVAEGVVARWHMDDTGTKMVDSARSHDGTLHNVATGMPGSLRRAFGFNGSSSYALVPQADDLSAVDKDVTVSIRMKTAARPPHTVADWDLIRSAGSYPGGDQYKVEYDPRGVAHCAFRGSSGYVELRSDPARPLDDGAWHSIRCVKTATQVKAIVDGRATVRNANIGTIVITKGIIFGAHPNPAGTGGLSEWYKGRLDEASIKFG